MPRNSTTARLFVVEQSILGTGSHHAELAGCLSRAARRRDWEVILGVNRRCRSWDRESFDQVRPVFSHTVYQGCSQLAGLQQTRRRSRQLRPTGPAKPASIFSWPRRQWQNWRALESGWRWERQRERFISQFTKDLGEFFRPFEFEEHDQVVLATVSELELLGTLSFLLQNPRTLNSRWSFLFHFGVFSGPALTHASQNKACEGLRREIVSLLQHLPYHRLSFAATTNGLCEQYLKLGLPRVLRFHYPVHEMLIETEPERSHWSGERGGEAAVEPAWNPSRKTERVHGDWRPTASEVVGSMNNFEETGEACRTKLDASAGANDSDGVTNSRGHTRTPRRLVLAGGVRREKGQTTVLAECLKQLLPCEDLTGAWELVVQEPRRPWWRPAKLRVPEEVHGAARIEKVNHPLPAAEYRRLIQEADVGILWYDRESYRERCAGVLGEFLAAGKPVIVAAGNWLSDQLEESANAYARDLRRQFANSRAIRPDELQYSRSNVPLSGGIWSFDQERNPFQVAWDSTSSAGGVAIEFEWHYPCTPGTHSRWRMSVDGVRQPLSRVVGCPHPQRISNLFFPLAPGARRIALEICNPFDGHSLAIKNVKLWELPERARQFPRSQVGWAVSEPAEFGQAVRELFQHWTHYQTSARRAAARWAAHHHPDMALSDVCRGPEIVRPVRRAA